MLLWGCLLSCLASGDLIGVQDCFQILIQIGQVFHVELAALRNLQKGFEALFELESSDFLQIMISVELGQGLDCGIRHECGLVFAGIRDRNTLDDLVH